MTAFFEDVGHNFEAAEGVKRTDVLVQAPLPCREIAVNFVLFLPALPLPFVLLHRSTHFLVDKTPLLVEFLVLELREIGEDLSELIHIVAGVLIDRDVESVVPMRINHAFFLHAHLIALDPEVQSLQHWCPLLLGPLGGGFDSPEGLLVELLLEGQLPHDGGWGC